MDAGRWLAMERGSLTPDEVVVFEAIELAVFPLAERLPAKQLVNLFEFRERLPKSKNGLPTEADNPQNNEAMVA
jgi:hypothetical protein